MEFTFKDKISTKSIIIPWIIRTYLHRRLYNFLVIFVKGLAVLLIFYALDRASTFSFWYGLLLFFYFELYILYRTVTIYFRLKNVFGNNREVEYSFSKDKLVIKDAIQTRDILMEGFTRVKETKWFIFIYKKNTIVLSFYKPLMKKEDVLLVQDYYKNMFQENYKKM